MSTDEVIAALPKTADGAPVFPGMELFRTYRGEVWSAVVVAVRSVTIDVRYTNEGRHASKHATSRRRTADRWYSTEEAAMQGQERAA